MKSALERLAGEVFVPALILPELDYLLSSRLSPAAMEDFLTDLREGGYQLFPFDHTAFLATMEWTDHYAHLQIGITDASVASAAERLRADGILTTDLRHFRTFRRMSDRRPFTLLPWDAQSPPG